MHAMKRENENQISINRHMLKLHENSHTHRFPVSKVHTFLARKEEEENLYLIN